MPFIHPDFLLETAAAKRLFHDYAENEPILDSYRTDWSHPNKNS